MYDGFSERLDIFVISVDESSREVGSTGVIYPPVNFILIYKGQHNFWFGGQLLFQSSSMAKQHNGRYEAYMFVDW